MIGQWPVWEWGLANDQVMLDRREARRLVRLVVETSKNNSTLCLSFKSQCVSGMCVCMDRKHKEDRDKQINMALVWRGEDGCIF